MPTCMVKSCDEQIIEDKLCGFHLKVLSDLEITDEDECRYVPCIKPSMSRGLCSTHYTQFSKYGIMKESRTSYRAEGSDKCLVKKCSKRAIEDNLCEEHVQMLRNLPIVNDSCRVPDCTSRHSTRHLCSSHYNSFTHGGQFNVRKIRRGDRVHFCNWPQCQELAVSRSDPSEPIDRCKDHSHLQYDLCVMQDYGCDKRRERGKVFCVTHRIELERTGVDPVSRMIDRTEVPRSVASRYPKCVVPTCTRRSGSMAESVLCSRHRAIWFYTSARSTQRPNTLISASPLAMATFLIKFRNRNMKSGALVHPRILESIIQMPIAEPDDYGSALDLARNSSVVKSASRRPEDYDMFAVTDKMGELVLAAADTIDEVDIQRIDVDLSMPSSQGLLLIPTDKITYDGWRNSRLNWMVIAWSLHDGECHYSAWARNERRGPFSTDESAIQSGLSLVGEGTLSRGKFTGPHAKLLFAFWRLIDTDGPRDVDEDEGRQALIGPRPLGIASNSDGELRIYDLKVTGEDEGDTGQGSSSQQSIKPIYQHDGTWIVRRHKRWQWYPRENTHKLIWIGPYIKGDQEGVALSHDVVRIAR